MEKTRTLDSLNEQALPLSSLVNRALVTNGSTKYRFNRLQAVHAERPNGATSSLRADLRIDERSGKATLGQAVMETPEPSMPIPRQSPANVPAGIREWRTNTLVNQQPALSASG